MTGEELRIRVLLAEFGKAIRERAAQEWSSPSEVIAWGLAELAGVRDELERGPVAESRQCPGRP